MNFVAIDFEVANMWNRSSACSIGIAEYKNGHLSNEVNALINPNDDFDPYCIDIHKITPEMVINQPTFGELWPDIKSYFENRTIIAHNASFDMSVLRYCLNEYGISFPDCDYICTYSLSKRIYTELPSYRLDYLVNHLNLPDFHHHQALDDAKAAANLLFNFMDTTQTDDFITLTKNHDYSIGKIISGHNTYKPFSSTRKYKNRKSRQINPRDITTDITNFDEDHPFFEKHFVFTGTLSSMSRSNAMQKVVDLGGVCGSNVTMKSNYLVVGRQDFSRLTDGKKSSKMKRAEDLAHQGIEVEIITEDDFLKLL